MHTDIVLGSDDSAPLHIDPARTIFWTGAGISCIAPSSLPLGNGLTDAYLSASLGDKWKDFVALWNNNFPQIKASVQDGKWFKPEPVGTFTAANVDSGEAWERPRLEYIIGEMDKMDKYFSSIHFYKDENNTLFHRASSLAALVNFALVEPCLYHYRLAELSRAGSVVVTANFDNGIEKALGVDSRIVERKYGTPAVSNGCGGYIYHFHGIATDKPDNLRATISSMSKGLDDDFQDYIKELFLKGYDIVFIGYGGVDFFDVEPFFKEMEEGSYSGKAIYLQYSWNTADAEDKKAKDKNYLYLLAPFQNQYIAYGDTEKFFGSIYNSYSTVSTSSSDCGAFGKTKDALKKIVKEQKDEDLYHFLNMFRLCSQLNINPGRFYPDWIERISGIFKLWEKDGTDTLERMTVVNNQKSDGIIDDIYSNNWHDTDLTSTGMAKELKPYIDSWEKNHTSVMLKFNRGYGFPLPKSVIRKYVDQTVEILKGKKTDEESGDISRGTVLYICGWQTKAAIFLYRISRGLIKGRLLFLKKCIDELLQYPFTRFRYRTHYLSLCRQAAYIEAVLHKGERGYEGNIQKEWDICMQTPILYDAGQVLNARLVQAKMYGLTDGVDELTEIRNRILDLRKATTDLS